MYYRGETLQNFPTQEHALSQQELGPQVRELFDGFKEAFGAIPELKDLAGAFSSHNSKLTSVETVLLRGLDKWIVKHYLMEEKTGIQQECLKITVGSSNERTQGFGIVTLRTPYIPYMKNGGDVDISYNRKRLLFYSSPTDTSQNNTQSALDSAKNMLDQLKALPISR